MKISSIDRQEGFTLVEVIATIVIAGVIGAMTFSFFGKSFVESPKTVSRLNKALGLQAVMENITQDYTRNYASNLSGLKTKVGTENTTYSNSYGSYKLIYNRYIKFNSTGGTESSMMPGTDLLKVTIQQVDTGEKLTALFATGGASGSGGCCGGGGCGGGGGGMGDTTPPTVISTTPSNGATNVDVNSTVSVTFSENMTSTTVTTSRFTVTNNTTGSTITGTVTGSGSNYSFTPLISLDVNTTYTVTITTGVTDSSGNAMMSDYTWSFVTSATTTDTTPPTISSTYPTNNAMGLMGTINITATFSEAMDPTTINSTTFALKTSGGSSVPGDVSYSGMTATFNPTNDLSCGVSYTATISTGAKDVVGNAMQSNDTWSFKTKGMGCY